VSALDAAPSPRPDGHSLYFIFFVPAHVLISVMVDTICIGFLFIFAIGSVGALSSYVGWWGNFTGTSTLGSLLDATVGLGWVMVFLVSHRGSIARLR
jgi:hypothetical protein